MWCKERVLWYLPNASVCVCVWDGVLTWAVHSEKSFVVRGGTIDFPYVTWIANPILMN